MTWYKSLGMEKDPFINNIIELDLNLIGREDECKEVIYQINSGGILIIQGPTGSGKTSLLKFAIDNFKGDGRVIYIDAKKLSRRLNISDLIKNKLDGMILLMDNVQSLSGKNNDQLKYYYDEDKIKSIIFTIDDYTQVNFSESLKQRIGNNRITLNPLSQDQVIQVIKSKLNNNSILPINVIKKLYNLSENLSDLMYRCSLLCSFLVENKKKKATLKDVNKVFNTKSKSDNSNNKFMQKYNDLVDNEVDIELCADCGGKLIQVGEHWRCEECDQYCTGCGSIVQDDDITCPVCNAEFDEVN
jgi:Cdc6-like AAA superfamily ATPase